MKLYSDFADAVTVVVVLGLFLAITVFFPMDLSKGPELAAFRALPSHARAKRLKRATMPPAPAAEAAGPKE